MTIEIEEQTVDSANLVERENQTQTHGQERIQTLQHQQVHIGEQIQSKLQEQSLAQDGEHAQAQLLADDYVRKILVSGQELTELPADLYIPPEALKVFLEIFEGPLDLLLYLIRRQNLDILDIPVAEITRQYVDYIEVMHILRLDLAGEYLEMAAILAEIKSRMLLPRPVVAGEEEIDPRAELVRRLQEYEVIKQAAQNLDQIPRAERDLFTGSAGLPEWERKQAHPEVSFAELLLALKDVLVRSDLQTAHNIGREQLSVRERMSRILATMHGDTFVEFVRFFDVKEGRLGVVVTFLAILEMVREAVLELVQAHQYAPIYVRLAVANE